MPGGKPQMPFDTIRTGIILTAVLFLPFTWELVYNAGFPLKVYEVLFGLGLVLSLARYRNFLGFFKLRSIQAIVLFFFIALVTGLISFRLLAAMPQFPFWATGRDHPYGSIFFELAYLALDIGIMLLIMEAIVKQEKTALLLVLIVLASVIASGYGFLQLAGHYGGFSGNWLPSMPDRKAVFDFIIPRITSFFKEPNYLAGFLVCVTPIAIGGMFHTEIKPWYCYAALAILFFALYFTFSTGGWLIFIMVSFYLLWQLRQVDRIKALWVGALLVVVIILLVFANPRIFYEVMYDKLFGRFINPNTISRIQRKEQILNALILFARYPLTGIGLSNYGLVADWVFNFKSTFNMTVNNIYAEILCEMGIAGLLVFLYFIFKVYRMFRLAIKQAKGNDSLIIIKSLYGSFLSLVMMLNFSPSHSLAFIWVMLGFYLGYLLLINKKQGV